MEKQKQDEAHKMERESKMQTPRANQIIQEKNGRNEYSLDYIELEDKLAKLKDKLKRNQFEETFDKLISIKQFEKYVKHNEQEITVS